MNNINKKIEETLDSWDNIEKFQATPFLYTRIEQQIKNIEAPPQKMTWNWVWQPLLVAMLVVLNFFTISTALDSNESSNQSVYDVMAEQYNISTDNDNTILELY